MSPVYSGVNMKLIVLGLICSLGFAAAPKGQRSDGFVPYIWDEPQGKLWLEAGHWGREFLYVTSLPAGVGSNDIGLDRGQLGGAQVVRWERSGNKVLLVASNYGYRALSSSDPERRAVRESFAESVLWGFEASVQEDGKVYVDAAQFLLRDSHGVAEALQRARQGTYRLDSTRCAFYLPRTRNFPKNTEVEATITLTGGPGGPLLDAVTPSKDAVTVRTHHSFVELPGPGFEPREFDPRAGYFARSYYDFASPIGEPVVKRFIHRHRLAPGGVITYYLDRGAPEPIRGALLEGARWWSQAFEAAGFPNGFKVELLPEDADPMDVRYNMIQWVHRSTRGWSYGASVADPRTGEIIKGHVTLGSLRVRQDFLIAEAFLAPYGNGAANPQALEMALARLRQLSAHEVGHTLGLGHNYIASTANRASVMDYPHPWMDLKNGVPDFGGAYAKGIGEWDMVSIQWGYGVSDAGGRDALIRDARSRGLVYLTDQDARPAGSAHPEVHLWDSGSNAVDELERLMKVRAAALARFGENNIRQGTPLALLEDVLVPLYLSHRYQVEAAVKTVGGLRYSYALRGDGQQPTTLAPAAEQRRALDAVLQTISPEALAIPERIIRLIPPRPAGYQQTRELFKGRTGLTFDPVGAAESAAAIVLDLLLNGERASRLVEFHARDAAQPPLGEVIDRLWTKTWKPAPAPGLQGEIQRTVQLSALRRVMSLAVDEAASGGARAAAGAKISDLKSWLSLRPRNAHISYALAQIAAFEKDPKEMRLPKAQEAPPGMPIGNLDCDFR
ncbi:MAG: zinc-dependent metalloprotease [Candidatus Solibacter usitatus]|nr:zinc-dependent metalloprotease [Candidatus Solibacter usitatus]